MKAETFERLEGDAEILSQRITRSLSSPFGPWNPSVNRHVAIAMLSVYGLIFLAGLIGHVCVVAYAVSSRRKYHTCRRGALLIIANLSISQMLFLLFCLPSIAYKSIMNLTFEPWILGDIACRMVPFVELFILGVTVLSFCVLSIDRLRSAGQNTKTYEEAGDSCLTGICKIFVIWLGAMLIASPEIFVYKTVTQELQIPENIFDFITNKDSSLKEGILPDYKELKDTENIFEDLKIFFEKIHTSYVMGGDEFVQANVTTFGMTYQYDKCVRGVSLWVDSPNFLVTFMHTYENVRLWWIFGFYFCLPVFFSLLFAMIIARHLSATHDKCLKDFGTYPVDGAVGTLTSHKGGSIHRSNSLASNQTASSEAQQLMLATEGRPGALTPNNGSLRNHLSASHRSASPAGSFPSMMTPMIVRSSNAPISPTNETGIGYAQSVISPSVTSPSMTSVMYDVNGKTASLPPHGRGSRSKGKVQRIILFNVARDRALNTLLVALILAYSLTWLPQHIFHILFAKTQLEEALDAQYVGLILDVCRYLSAFSFAVNPAVIYLAYKSYRIFLDRFCCPCKCRCTCC
ncbi:uncharacterized protein LOC120338840 [Styela clava]